MQAKKAAVGLVGVDAKEELTRKEDKILRGELASNISSKSHLPESFSLMPLPEDRRPVISQIEERFETTTIHNTHSWEDVADNLVTTREEQCRFQLSICYKG
jgi:hypothetical protein